MTAPTGNELWKRRKELFHGFTSHITGLLNQPGVRAELRLTLRLGPAKAHGANRHLLMWLDEDGNDYADLLEYSRTRNALLTTAGLMAQFPTAPTLRDTWEAHKERAGKKHADKEQTQTSTQRAPRLDLGLALAELDRAKNKTGTQQHSATPQRMSPREVRLMQLCRTDADRLPRYVFSTLTLIKSSNHKLPSWAQMAEDLDLHAFNPDRVAQHWQKSFLIRPPWRR